MSNDRGRFEDQDRTGGGSPRFHPYQLAICGYSGAGKTTLVEKLLREFSAEYRIGYVKHDAHRFQMDRPGKDTYRATEAGAAQVLITNSDRTAHLASRALGRVEAAYAMLDADWVLIEGYKDSDVPKILVLDAQGRAAREWAAGSFRNVVACVSASAAADSRPVPWFHRDDVEGLVVFVREFWRRRLAEVPIYGLVLTSPARRGGEARTRARSLEEILSAHCERTFLSPAAEPPAGAALAEPTVGQILRAGPMGRIVSAMQTHPGAAWLVLAVGLPYVDREVVHRLVARRAPFKLATTHPASGDTLPEPLCTIYEPKARLRLLQGLGLGGASLQEILAESNTALV